MWADFLKPWRKQNNHEWISRFRKAGIQPTILPVLLFLLLFLTRLFVAILQKAMTEKTKKSCCVALCLVKPHLLWICVCIPVRGPFLMPSAPFLCVPFHVKFPPQSSCRCLGKRRRCCGCPWPVSPCGLCMLCWEPWHTNSHGPCPGFSLSHISTLRSFSLPSVF